MTAKAPEDRITSAAEVAAALEPFAQGAELSTLCAAAAMTRIASAPNSHTPVSTGRKGGGRKRLWALLATALVALAAVIVFETDRGRIVITSQRDDVNVIVKRNDKLYDEWELTRGTNDWKIRSGHIEIILPAGNEDLRVTNNSFQLTRNGKVEVTIERKPPQRKEAAGGREYSYQTKTWDEWIEILEREQSAEGLIDAVDAVGRLGRKEKQTESLLAVLKLIRERGAWDIEADTPEGKLSIALGQAVRRLLADGTSVPLRDAIQQGESLERFFVLHHLIAPYGESSQQEGSRHFENLKAQYPVLLQGIDAASRDANVKTAQSALTILSLFGVETPVFRNRLERMLERKEPVELISGAVETIENKKDYDAWRPRALTQLIERLPLSQEKKTWNDLEHYKAEAWFMGLARMGRTAAPAIPGLIRVVESKPRWIDETFTDTRFTRAKDLSGGRTIQRSSIRVAAILTLGAIGERAEPGLPAIRKLKTSKEEHLREAALAAEAAITGKPVDLPEPKTSSAKPASAPKVGGANFYFKAKTWNEWVEIAKREQSTEGLIDAVDAIGQLGRKEKPQESLAAVLELIRDRGMWSHNTRSPEGKLCITMGGAIRALLSDETAPLMRDADVKAAGQALGMLAEYSLDTPLYRKRLERLLKEREPGDLLMQAVRTVRDKKEYDAWTLQALTQLIERISDLPDKDMVDEWERVKVLNWLTELASLGDAAAPAVSGLIRIVEAKPSWVDLGFTAREYSNAYRSGDSPSTDVRTTENRKGIFLEGQLTTVRIAAVLVLGHMGPKAAPALPAIRKLREFVAGAFTDKTPSRDGEWVNREVHRATLVAEAAITGKPVRKPTTSSTKPKTTPALRVAGKNFYFKAKTWDEWIEIVRHEQSAEGLTDAVTAIGQLGRKEKQTESLAALLLLIPDRGTWSYAPGSPEGDLHVALGDALRALLSDETAPMFRDVLLSGESLERYFVLANLARVYSDGKDHASTRHFADLKNRYAVLEPGVDAASRDADVKAAGRALGMLAEYSLDTPLYRKRLERLVEKKEPAELIAQALRTVRDKQEYDAWKLQALTQLIEQFPAQPRKYVSEQQQRSQALEWFADLAVLSASAAPAVPGLIRIVEAKPGWIDAPISVSRRSSAAGLFANAAANSQFSRDRGTIFPDSQMTTLRIAAALMLGRIGKQATPALPAIRRLRESVAGMFSDKPTRDTVEMFNRETHRATREAEAAITGKPVDLPEPKTSSTKPSPAPKVAGTNFYFKAKTWDEWMEVLRHEQSPEGLTDAVTAIASLGRKAKQKESVQALLWLIDERAPWRKPRSKHYVTLNVEMQLATRALLSAETVPLFNEALKNGPSKRRQFLIDTLRHGPASDRFPLRKQHAEPVHFQSLLPGVEAASHDEDFRVQLSALTYLHEFGSESKLFRERLDQALNKRESLDTIRFMMQTVRNDKEWDEWRIRAVAQFFERTQLAMAKDDPANADLLILVVTLIDLGKSEEAAAPLVPALTRIIESDLKWIDRTDLTEEHGQAAKTLHSPLKWRNGPVLGLPLSAPKSIRAAVVLTLGAIGKQAEPALPAIRKLKTSQEQHLREAAIIAEKAITAKPAETTKAPATGSTGPSKVSPTKTTAP